MKYLLILFYTLFLTGCRDLQNGMNTDQQHLDSTSSGPYGITNQISRHLTTCLTDEWTAWEETSEDQKTYLAHIGKGTFDLHMRANYELEDTLLNENYNGKNGRKYHSELILHFYQNSEDVRESVKFTKENPTIISDLNFAEYFGETDEFLIYECSTEKQIFLPTDPKIIELRECLLDKISTYNSK